jgi:hypothetical protein
MWLWKADWWVNVDVLHSECKQSHDQPVSLLPHHQPTTVVTFPTDEGPHRPPPSATATPDSPPGLAIPSTPVAFLRGLDRCGG